MQHDSDKSSVPANLDPFGIKPLGFNGYLNSNSNSDLFSFSKKAYKFNIIIIIKTEGDKLQHHKDKRDVVMR